VADLVDGKDHLDSVGGGSLDLDVLLVVAAVTTQIVTFVAVDIPYRPAFAIELGRDFIARISIATFTS
jgi:hypothetical protein